MFSWIRKLLKRLVATIFGETTEPSTSFGKKSYRSVREFVTDVNRTTRTMAFILILVGLPAGVLLVTAKDSPFKRDRAVSPPTLSPSPKVASPSATPREAPGLPRYLK